MIDVIEHGGRKYLSIDDYLDHLNAALETVMMMVEGLNAPNSSPVILTLQTSIEFLESL